MILGIGIDVVHVRRLERWLAVPGLAARFFHPDELETALSRRSGAALSLAARFAAKEALGKALGSGLRGMKLTDIQVINNYNGKPAISLHGGAAAALAAVGGRVVHLSLTHESDNAIAMVVVEG